MGGGLREAAGGPAAGSLVCRLSERPAGRVLEEEMDRGLRRRGSWARFDPIEERPSQQRRDLAPENHGRLPPIDRRPLARGQRRRPATRRPAPARRDVRTRLTCVATKAHASTFLPFALLLARTQDERERRVKPMCPANGYSAPQRGEWRSICFFRERAWAERGTPAGTEQRVPGRRRDLGNRRRASRPVRRSLPESLNGGRCKRACRPGSGHCLSALFPAFHGGGRKKGPLSFYGTVNIVQNAHVFFRKKGARYHFSIFHRGRIAVRFRSDGFCFPQCQIGLGTA